MKQVRELLSGRSTSLASVGEAIACPLRNRLDEPFVQLSRRLASFFLMSRNTSQNQRVSAPALVLQPSVDLLPDGCASHIQSKLH